MSLDINKISKLFQENDIVLCEYFCMDSKCIFIKCYMIKLSIFLLLYIPSKYRFTPPKNCVIYDIEEIEENTENDDYSKTTKITKIEKIDEEKSVSKYQELSKKYKTSIISDENDEPVSRKIKRQIERLSLPFSGLSYDIAIFNNKFLAVSFGDSITIYNIKRSQNGRNLMYFANFKHIIDKLEDINDDLNNVKTQFQNIIKKISLSNMNDISSENFYNLNYSKILEDVSIYFNDFDKSINESISIYLLTKEKEDELILEYKSKLKDNSNRMNYENKIQSKLNELFNTKNELLRKGMSLSNKFSKFILILEETSFDNLIMTQRVKKNFDLLQNSIIII